MSLKKQAAHTDADFFPENVEFLGFIGGWDCYTGVDPVQGLFYLIRTSELDWLEEVIRYSGRIVSRKCVGSLPRDGSKREASARLLDAYLRSRVHIYCPDPPYRSGLLAGGELKSIVTAIADELKRNSEAAEEKQRQHEAPIIKAARELRSILARRATMRMTGWRIVPAQVTS